MKKARAFQKPTHLLIAFSLTLVWLLPSCDHTYLRAIDEMDSYTYSPTFAIPLFNSGLSFDELFLLGELDNIELDEDRMIILSYDARIFSMTADRLFSLPNQNQIINISGITPPPSGSITTDPQLFLITFDQNERLHYVLFDEGVFNLSLESPQMEQDGYQVEVSFRILNSDDGSGQQIQGSASLGDPNPGQTNLAGSSISFGDDSPNVFAVEYTLTFSGNGTPNNAPYTLQLTNSLREMEFDYLEGYIDQISFPIGSADIPLSIFNNSFDGSIYFEDPNIEFFIQNTFGLEIDLITDEISAILANDSIRPITGSAFDTPWRVVPPPDSTYQIINRNNTDLFDITLDSPRRLNYEVSGFTNPDGLTPQRNWVSKESDLAIDMRVNLPLYGRIDYFYLKDTIPAALSELPDELEWIELTAITTNEFPFSVELFIELIDENDVVLDTLFNDQPRLLEAGITDPVTGITTTPSESQTQVLVDESIIGALLKTDKMILNALISTHDSDAGSVVKLLDNYRVNVELKARGKGSFTIDFE